MGPWRMNPPSGRNVRSIMTAARPLHASTLPVLLTTLMLGALLAPSSAYAEAGPARPASNAAAADTGSGLASENPQLPETDPEEDIGPILIVAVVLVLAFVAIVVFLLLCVLAALGVVLLITGSSVAVGMARGSVGDGLKTAWTLTMVLLGGGGGLAIGLIARAIGRLPVRWWLVAGPTALLGAAAGAVIACGAIRAVRRIHRRAKVEGATTHA